MENTEQNTLNNVQTTEQNTKPAFEKTDIFLKRSRDAQGITLQLGGIKYKVLLSEFEMMMKEVCDSIALYSIKLVNGDVKLEESGLTFNISKTGAALILKHEDSTYSIQTHVMDKIFKGDQKGAFLSKLPALTEEQKTEFKEQKAKKKAKNKQG